MKESEKLKEYNFLGTIPVWLNGSLLRNGPGRMKIGSSTYEHVFDGSALLHRYISSFIMIFVACVFQKLFKKIREFFVLFFYLL